MVLFKGTQIWIKNETKIDDYLAIKDFIEKTDGKIELHFDSSGGSVLGIGECAECIYKNKERIFSYIHGACTSAAYWLACASSKIILCSKTTILGSIGIKIQHIDKSKMLEMQGIKVKEIATGENKKLGSENIPLSNDDEKILFETVKTLFMVFVEFVEKCRKIPKQKIIDMQAKEYIGEDAIYAGLADELGENKLDIETLQKENEELKKENEMLKQKIEELIAIQESQTAAESESEEMIEEEKKDDEKEMQAERHRVLAIMSLNKGGISESIVPKAIASGWNYEKTVDEITTKLSESKKNLQANSRIVPLGNVDKDRGLANLIAKGGK